jgi:hypothetical protein
VPLGLSPIPVLGPPASISDALPVLDSIAERLRRLDQILDACLKAEGSRLCRAVVDYVLTCFRSHDPAMSLALVLDGPVAATEDAARESVQDVVETVAARFQRDPADAEYLVPAEIRLGFCLKADVINFVFVRYFGNYQSNNTYL